MPNYKLYTLCTTSDATQLSKNNTAAFWGEAWWRVVWPSRTIDSLMEAMAARIPLNLLTDRELRRHQKVVECESDNIVGYARWIMPKSQNHAWIEAQTPEVDSEAEKYFKELYAKADFNPREDMDETDEHVPGWRKKYKHDMCIELDYLAVHPDHHRRGIGSMLLASGIQKAEELGLDICLVAMGRKALGMYQKAGFQVLDSRVQDLSPYGVNVLYETFYLIKRSSNATSAQVTENQVSTP